MASDPPQEESWYEELTLRQQQMIKACETGDVLNLQNLFDAAAVRPGATPTQRTIDTIYPSGPPATSDMLHTAISHHQPAILELLLKTYPSVCILDDVLLGSTCANPDLPTLKVLHSYDSSIVNYNMEQNDGLDTLLGDYCRDGDPLLAEYLLDNGADPNKGGLPCFGPLLTATTSDQPLSLINKIVQSGAKVSELDVLCAIRQQRADILELLLNQRRWEFHWSQRSTRKRILREAHESKNREIISITENYMKENRKWWQFLK